MDVKKKLVELPQSFLWFTGNGVENIFREVY